MKDFMHTEERKIPYIFEKSSAAICRGSYILTHGLGTSKYEYLDFYTKLSIALQAQGFNVLRFDFSGHGDSTESGHLFNLTRCFYETAVMAKYLCSELTLDERLNFFGTSFGAGPAVFAAALFANKTERVTLLAPAIQYWDLYIDPTTEARKSRYKEFLNASLFAGGSVEIDQRVELGWQNAIEFTTINLERQITSIADRLSVIHGTADEAIPVDLVRLLFEQLQGARFIERPGMEHGYTVLGDETGNSPESLANFEAIVAEACRAY